VKTLGGPVVKGGRRRGGAVSAREGLGLTGTDQGVGGKSSALDISQLTGLVSDVGTAAKVQKLRREGGVVTGDVGSGGGAAEIIDIKELKTMSSEDITLLLKEAPVQINRAAIKTSGSGSKAKQRNMEALSNVIQANKQQVQYCFAVLKRRDSSLKGKVEVAFTIAPSGEVIRVSFRNSDWGGNPLGSECEKCISNVISAWHFDPIGPNDGNVTTQFSYVFGS